MCGWLNEDNKYEETKVKPWWAVENFRVVALAYAQQKAYQRATREEVKDKDGNISQMSGFIDVEERNVGIEMDNTPIHSLTYLPSYNVRTGEVHEKDAHGNFIYDKRGKKKRRKTSDRPLKTVPAKWMGYSKLTKETIDLTEEFVQDNFTQGFLDNLKHNARKANGTFIEVPARESRGHKP